MGFRGVSWNLPPSDDRFPQANAVLRSCRGVVRVDVNLQDVDIDQCSSDGWFAGTHRCNATTMEVSDPTAANRYSSATLLLLHGFLWRRSDQSINRLGSDAAKTRFTVRD